MTVILSWVIALMGCVILALLGSRSYHKHQRTLTEQKLEATEERLGVAAKEAGDRYAETRRQLREIEDLQAQLAKAELEAKYWREEVTAKVSET